MLGTAACGRCCAWWTCWPRDSTLRRQRTWRTLRKQELSKEVGERLFDEHPDWLWFAQGSFQYNETEAYKTRTKAFGGLGYLVSRTDNLKMLLKGGLGASKDRNGDSDVTPRSLLGYSVDWAINDLVQLTSSGSIENDIGSYSEYLVVLELELTVTVSKLNNLGLYLTLRDEYDSSPSPGDSWNQVWMTMGLNYSF